MQLTSLTLASHNIDIPVSLDAICILLAKVRSRPSRVQKLHANLLGANSITRMVHLTNHRCFRIISRLTGERRLARHGYQNALLVRVWRSPSAFTPLWEFEIPCCNGTHSNNMQVCPPRQLTASTFRIDPWNYLATMKWLIGKRTIFPCLCRVKPTKSAEIKFWQEFETRLSSGCLLRQELELR
jgi:hypothetical protein